MKQIRRLFSRLGAFFARERHDRDLALELSSHFEFLVEEHVREGCAMDEARRLAHLQLGVGDGVKEKCRDARGLPWLEDLGRDLRQSVRALRLNPGFALIALLTLSLGTAGTTVMFAVVNAVLFKPLPYPDADRLVVIHGSTKQFSDTFGTTPFDYEDFKRDSKLLPKMAAWSYQRGTATHNGLSQFVNARGISSNLFDVLGTPVTKGRGFLPEEDKPGAAPVALISQRLWRELFGGSSSVLGTVLVFDGKTYTVVGIAPSDFELGGNVDLAVPLRQEQSPRIHNRDVYMMQVMARLRPGATLAQAESELSLIGARLARAYPASNAGRSYSLHPIRQDIVGNAQPTLWLLLAAVTAVLLIACVNIASLLLARAVSREREAAMRLAMGARRIRLVRQCLTESAILGLCGGALGTMIATVGVRPFVLLWPAGLPRAEEISVDWHVLLFALAASIGCSVLFGLAPALRTPADDLEQALRAGGRSITGQSRIHTGFVATQIALAIVLLVAAGILGRTMLRLSSVDTGLNPANVLIARAEISPAALQSPERMRAVWREFLDRAEHARGVKFAAISDMVPMRSGSNALPYWTTSDVPPPNAHPSAFA